MKRLLLVVAFFSFAVGYANAADANRKPAAAAITERRPSDIEGVDFLTSYEPGPFSADYEAETACDLPDTDPYVIAHGADKGLVFLKDEGDRQVRHYAIPRARIRAVIRIKYDMTVLDRADLVFTEQGLVLVHTSTSTAGVFTSSDIYPLTYKDGRAVDGKHLIHDPSLSRMLAIGVSSYHGVAPSAR